MAWWCLLSITLAWSFKLSTAQALSFEVSRYVIEGENPLGENRTQSLLKPYTGQQHDIARLREASQLLESYLLKRGYQFHRVSLPPQKLDGGTVVLKVTRLSIGKVDTFGNRVFSDANLKRSLPQLAPGKTPNSKALTRVLAVANANSAKRTQLTFGRGAVPGTMDAQITVRDSDPQQLYTWLNNTGNEQSTRSRLGLGFSHRNLWHRDHQLSLTASVSPEDTGKVSQYGFNYQIPIYRTAGMLNLLGAKSTANTGRVAEVFDISGGGETLGIGYTQILNKIGAYRQQLQLNLTDKLFENDVAFSGEDIGQDVRSRPLSLAYQGEWGKNGWSGLVNIAFAGNQKGGRYNDVTSYEASRAGASNSWNKTNLTAQLSYQSAKQWQTELSLVAQQTTDKLIAGEKFGLGGVTGPKGFEERESTFDKGGRANLVVWTPPIKQFRFGWFYEIGQGTTIDPQTGEIEKDSLASTGIGIKWSWKSKLLLDISYGYVLDGVDDSIEAGTREGDARAHINLMYRFL